MQKFIFILGGARSGKSSYAVGLAKRLSKKVVFIATCTSFDKEMRKRIRLHKSSRPKEWRVIEEGRYISRALLKLPNDVKVVLIDCVGLIVSNLLQDNLSDDEILTRMTKLFSVIEKASFSTILVSNEVGMGLVPRNALARRFRDIMGMVNQMAAKEADETIFMIAGIPRRL